LAGGRFAQAVWSGHKAAVVIASSGSIATMACAVQLVEVTARWDSEQWMGPVVATNGQWAREMDTHLFVPWVMSAEVEGKACGHHTKASACDPKCGTDSRAACPGR
jgi:hypothetical protein